MDDQKLGQEWDRVLTKMKESLTEETVGRWLRPFQPISLTADKLVIGAPNDLYKNWVEERYIRLLGDAVSEIFGKDDMSVEIENLDLPIKISHPAIPKRNVKKENKKNRIRSDDDIQTTLIKVEEDYGAAYGLKQGVTTGIPQGESSTLNPKYTFDTFVTGKSNQFAYATALAVADAPGQKNNNPLFMYGGVGLGKTHLMHAIGHRILEQNPDKKVLYVSSEQFTNELINHIRDNSTELFRQKYRTIDVLMVDDIQFLKDKQSTQEEFFHTFNTLRDAEKQIILSSDRPPREVEKLEERLKSRFAWGSIADIHPPDLETRIAILKKKAQLDSVNVSDDVLFYIANRIDSNIRELESALTRVIAYSSLNHETPSRELAAEAMKGIYSDGGVKEVTLETIEKVVSDFYNIKVTDLHEQKRTRSIAYPRQIAMYLCREMTGMSLPQIASFFGLKNHTTVLHAHKKISDEKIADPKLAKTTQELMDRIKAM